MSKQTAYYGGRVQAMTKVRRTGWREGMRKISLTKFLQAELGLSLAASKQVVDDVLEGRLVLLDIPLEKDANALAHAIRELGASCTIEQQK